jgi:hypothetical protein
MRLSARANETRKAARDGLDSAAARTQKIFLVTREADIVGSTANRHSLLVLRSPSRCNRKYVGNTECAGGAPINPSQGICP